MSEINQSTNTTEQVNPGNSGNSGKSGKSSIEKPMEVPVHEREEREALDRAFASNDKLQFDNLIAQANLRNNDGIDHSRNAAKLAEVALANAVSFQQQMNQEYLRDVGQERSHGDDRHHLSIHGMQNLQEHNDIRYHHSVDNDRKTLSFLYDLEIPEAAANAMVVKAVEATITKMKASGQI